MSQQLLECKKCPRLRDFLKQVRKTHPDYHARPVLPFGDPKATFLIIGLAPGMHGANRTGRPFTGDYAGVLLYETLYAYGFSNRAESISADDGLKLKNCRITNAVKCLPPENKPTTEEARTCNPYLQKELADLKQGSVLLALGSIAHNAVLRTLGLKLSQYKFAHNVLHELPNGLKLVDSYHCSRYNTQTKRLTEKMFHDVFDSVVDCLAEIEV
ncbi:MAG: uracil-DNA glycosylase [Gammaproteobacteria bacterium]|nr:uracil-DNA glycosylase [Gammaproteobacteria bacterium]MDH5727924.1 uracil-DNA glycosylase [Gammaproteobacteria bacterium]